MLAKNLIRKKCKDNIYSNIVTIACDNIRQAFNLAKILHILGFQWKTGACLLDGDIEEYYEQSILKTYNSTFYMEIILGISNEKCIGYSDRIITLEDKKKVKAIECRDMIMVLKQIRRELKNERDYGIYIL